MQDRLHVVEHPLIAHKLTLMREKETPTAVFRTLAEEIALLLAYEVTRDFPLVTRRLETPLAAIDAPVLEGKKVVFVSILRAGNALLDGMLRVLPSARVAHVGLYRDPATLEAVEYYFKAPQGMEERDAIVVDPMLATGHSAIAAVTRLKETRPRSIKFVCLIAAPEGVEAFHAAHDDVPVYAAALDERLDEKGYIVPGLGDAGDRIYGTR